MPLRSSPGLYLASILMTHNLGYQNHLVVDGLTLCSQFCEWPATSHRYSVPEDTTPVSSDHTLTSKDP